MRRTHFTLYRDESGHDVQCTVISVGSGAPHVVLTALQHGNEILSLDAALQVLHQLGQGMARGTITLLTCLNPIGFREGSRNVLNRSFDLAGSAQMNLNRLHPGKPDGTLAERIAHAVDQYITRLSPDYLIDLHAYAIHSVPHIIVDPVQGAMLERVTAWAKAAGLPYYHEFAEENYTAQGLTNCLPGIWCERGVPAITLELGPQIGFSLPETIAAVTAVIRTLAAIGLTDMQPDLDTVSRGILQLLGNGSWQRSEIENTTAAQGYVRHRVGIGTSVRAGEVVADVVQLDGRVGGRILAPKDGVVFIWHDDPRAYPGSKLGIILHAHEV